VPAARGGLYLSERAAAISAERACVPRVLHGAVHEHAARGEGVIAWLARVLDGLRTLVDGRGYGYGPAPTAARDEATGISVRLVRDWGGERMRVVQPEYAGVLTDDGFYPSRVRSGRERSRE
jgi:hypothetical protein